MRPRYDDAPLALVVSIDRGRYGCYVDGQAITAVLARELGRGGVVVGDQVALVGDLSDAPGALARIVRIEPRTSVLRRSTDDGDEKERVIVANATQLVIVASLADPPPRTGLIDRCLVAAEDAGIEPLLCLTKADLADADPIVANYVAINLRYVVCRHDEPSTLQALYAQLIGRTSVLVGHSGVGKSTLVNALVPHAERSIGAVTAIGRGRHTSSSAVALSLPDGGWVIDTPGVRSFGLSHIPVEDLVHGYPDLLEGSLSCEPGCDHAEPKQGCALDAWVAAGHAPLARLVSFRALLASLRGGSR